MKEYIKPTLEIASLVPETDIANGLGNEFGVSAPEGWMPKAAQYWPEG